MPTTLAILSVLISLACIALVVHRWLQRRQLAVWMADLDSCERADERSIVTALASRLYGMRQEEVGRDPLMPLVGVVLGATPGAVIRSGGCCAGLSRLCIVALSEVGITARQVTLYHRAGSAKHCAVEVFLRRESIIVDPTYGLYYADDDGVGVGLSGLHDGVVPVLRALSTGEVTSYPPYPYYDYDYALTKTANWTKSSFRNAIYKALKKLVGARIDTFRVHPLLEWPQLQLVVILVLGLVALEVLGVGIATFSR